MTPCHDERGAVICQDESCAHANTFCGDCIAPLTTCSEVGCGAVCCGEDQVTYSRRDGSTHDGSDAVHGGEHVCRECEQPFCWKHFIVCGEVDEDAPEVDGLCMSCSAAAREGEMK